MDTAASLTPEQTTMPALIESDRELRKVAVLLCPSLRCSAHERSCLCV